MAEQLYEIVGFEELQAKIKKLSNDKDKRKPILAILRKSAASTIKVSRQLAPKDTGAGAKSIRFKAMRRARNPMGVVRPGADRWFYMRQFVIPGHNVYVKGYKRKSHRAGSGEKLFAARNKNVIGRVEEDRFMINAANITKTRVFGTAIPQMEKFIQKQINKL